MEVSCQRTFRMDHHQVTQDINRGSRWRRPCRALATRVLACICTDIPLLPLLPALLTTLLRHQEHGLQETTLDLKAQEGGRQPFL